MTTAPRRRRDAGDRNDGDDGDDGDGDGHNDGGAANVRRRTGDHGRRRSRDPCSAGALEGPHRSGTATIAQSMAARRTAHARTDRHHDDRSVRGRQTHRTGLYRSGATDQARRRRRARRARAVSRA
jgi:hypothetical protein